MRLNILPNTWLTKKLGDIFSLSAGGDVDKSLFSKKQDEQHPYPIYANALTNQGLYGYSSDYRVEQESITITGRGDIGKVFYRKGKYTPIVRVVVGNPKDNISAKYMSYACSKIRFFNETTGVPQLTVPQVASYKVLVPPLPEQEKIAEILSCWDDAIEQLTDLIAEKKQQKRSLMQRLLTGKQRLPGFYKPWKNVKLGDVGKITSAGVDKKIIEGEKKVRLLNYMDVYRNTFITDNTFSMVVSAPDKKIINCNLNKGDIFFTPSSETRGDIAHSAVVVEDIKDAVYSYHIVRLRLTQNMDLCFSGYIFDIESFYKQAYCLCEGSGQRYVLTQDYFRNMCVYIPSDISEQKAIANVLMTADTEIDQLNKKLDVLKEQKKGLMQKLLTGQIMVKVDKK